ncbi:hypothetical protein EYF80_058774 [Liparis tanakae]|uniref:Uncharacterized protein n=1 Tax=Liparis tanakae TaxID=230148 RepID=A0A4Z2EQK8_9TELE|nr:hypothetical protein EYF80_058774 [Liparis tanakae]
MSTSDSDTLDNQPVYGDAVADLPIATTEAKSVTSRYAAVIGGVTSEGRTRKRGHLAGWERSDHLIGRQQADAVVTFDRAGPEPASQERVSAALGSLHRR